MKTRYSLVACSIMGLLGASAHAANIVKLNHDQMSDPQSTESISAASDLNEALNLNQAHQFVEKQAMTFNSGITKKRFQQYYHGLEVFGHTVTAAQSEMGVFNDFDGSFVDQIENDLQSITPNMSLKSALQAAGIQAQKAIENEEQQLLIFIDKDAKAHLAYYYSFVTHSDEGPSRPTYYIDANSGKILDTWDNIQFKMAGGPGGNEKAGKYEYNPVNTDQDYPGFEVTDDCKMENENVKTINLNHSRSGGSVHQFDCGDADEGYPRNTHKEINGAYSPLNDAHYYGGEVFRMFKSYMNASPLTFQLTLRVHYGNSYENAFWDGSQMTFGDGASRFYPLVSLDVVAHEVSHGYTQQNSNLKYRNQPGGINESFSDISGEAAEYHMLGTNDFLVGGTIFKGADGKALRYFEDPTKDGRSIGHASDYNDSMNVHYSSGVFNRAFYNLATTTSQSGEQDWDVKMAFIAFATANKLHWGVETKFDEGGCGVKKAAKSLGYSEADVVAAFEIVGVNASCGDDPGDPGDPDPGPKLENGKEKTGLKGERSSESFYYMDVPAGATNLKFEIYDGSGDADIYVKFGDKPSRVSYDCRPYRWGNKEACSISNVQEGRYHVMVRGYYSYRDLKLKGSYDDGRSSE